MLTNHQDQASPLSRRQRRKTLPKKRLPPISVGLVIQSNPIGFNGAGDAREAKRKNRIAMNNRSSKRRGASPFDAGAVSDDNRQRRSNGASDRRKTTHNPKGIAHGGHEFRSKKFSESDAADSRPDNKLKHPPTYEVNQDAYPTDSKSPGVMPIWDQLRKDGIFPPKWPDMSDKAGMAKLRLDHEDYRERAQASVIKAMLWDDPDKQLKLEASVDFRGICEDFCPEAEMIQRLIEPDIPSVEKGPDNRPDCNKMMKKFARSSAGSGKPLPWDVLTIATTRRAMDYLVDGLLQSDENLARVHGYIWDRTRMIRRDFTFFSVIETAQEMKDQIYTYENIIRFHVTSLHHLSRLGDHPDTFSQQQELEQLSKTLMSLMPAYDNCAQHGIVCENEAEFRACYGLFFAGTPDIIELMQRSPAASKTWKESDTYRTAIALIETLQASDTMHGPLGQSPSHAVAGMPSAYFKIVEDPSISYTMACFAEIHFGRVRRDILKQLKKAFRRPKILSKDPTPSLLNSYLRFDTDEEAVKFIEDHGLSFVPHEDAPHDQSRKYLDVTGSLEHPRVLHTFSQKLVEIKRGNHSLPDVIHRTVYQGDSAVPGGQTKASNNEESLFFPLNGNMKDPLNASQGRSFNHLASSSNTTNQAAVSGNAASPFNSGNSAFSKAPANGTSPFAAPAATTSSTGSPFASASPTTTATPNNPFSSNPAAGSPFGTNSTTSSPFGQPAPSSNGSQNGPSSFKSPFASATPAHSPFAPSAPATSSPFSQGATTAPQQPSSNTEPKESFAPSPFGAPSAPKTSSPFAGFAPAPAEASKTPATVSEPKPATQPGGSIFAQAPQQPNGVPQASTSFPKFPSFAPTTASPPAPPAQAPLSTSATNNLASTPASQPSVPSFSFTKAPDSATTSVFAPKAATTTAPDNKPSSTLPPTFSLPEPQASSSAVTAPDQTKSSLFQPPSSSAGPSLFANATSSSTPMAQPKPKQDVMGDFTRWFVQGDGGLFEEFQEFIITDLVQKAYDQYRHDEAEKARKEEEAADLKKAMEFKVYNLRVKFFYRWRDIARARRLKRRRARDKEEYRAFMAAKQAEEVAAKKQAAAAEAAALKRSQKTDPVGEFRDYLQTRRDSAAEHEAALLASGVLTGVDNKRRAASNIVRGEFAVPPVPVRRGPRKSLPNGNSMRSPSPSQTPEAAGAKTRALREQLAGGSSSSFRRSLPPGATPQSSWRASSSPSEQPKRVSKVSDRWRLKAMGLVTMPDGTALPEKLANSMRYDGVRYEGWGSFGLDGNSHKRSRSTSADLNHSAAVRTAFVDSFRRSSGTSASDAADVFSPATTKRKRTVEDEAVKNGAPAKKQATTEDSIERILREARELRGSLRSSRMDLAETTDWFKEQSEMMQHEEMLSGRSSSAWGD